MTNNVTYQYYGLEFVLYLVGTLLHRLKRWRSVQTLEYTEPKPNQCKLSVVLFSTLTFKMTKEHNCGEPIIVPSETRPQYVSKDLFSALSPEYFPGKLWGIER